MSNRHHQLVAIGEPSSVIVSGRTEGGFGLFRVPYQLHCTNIIVENIKRRRAIRRYGFVNVLAIIYGTRYTCSASKRIYANDREITAAGDSNVPCCQNDGDWYSIASVRDKKPRVN